MAEYIEREALLKDIGETVLFSVRGGAELPTPGMRGSNKVIDRIKSAPTADVVEVRHGEWEKHTNSHLYWYKCSICGDYPPRNYYGHEYHSAYCPNCGAKMDGKGE